MICTFFVLYRVINVLKSMVSEPDILEREDMYILERMKEFLVSDEVSRMGAAKQLLIVIDRLVRNLLSPYFTIIELLSLPP
jgi:son of sevenless